MRGAWDGLKAAWDDPWVMMPIIAGWFVAMVVLVSCGSAPTASKGMAERPGDPATYAFLEASESCEALQAAFDNADTYRQRALGKDPADTFQADVSLSYMKAAEARMGELQCTLQTQGETTP